MNHRGRWRIGALASAVALLGSLASLQAHALSLGRITVQSALGEPLRGEIEITEINPEEASSLNVSLASAEAFKAAGFEYPSAASSLQIKLQRRADGKPYLRLNSSRAITEPFVDLILEARWSSGRLTRDYSMLFDPPATRTSAIALTAPVVAAPKQPPVETAAAEKKPEAEAPAPAADAAQPAPLAAASHEEKAEPTAVEAAPAPPEAKSEPAEQPAAAAPAPAAAAAPAPAPARTLKAASVQDAPDGPSQVTVKPGETASKIAARTKPSNVSLDQMLVALLRSNPNAFASGNVNMMKSGAVLEIPSEDTISATPASEASQLIVAQSKDFNAFRRKLAESVAAASVASADRQADGKLQARVEDQAKTSAATDTLSLSNSSVQGKSASTPEDKLVKEKEAQDSANRVAEIKKNINDLSKIGAASPAATAASGASAGPAITVSSLPAPAASAPAPAEAASSAATTSSAPLASASAESAASAPASDASAPEALAAASEPASAASEASAPASSAAKPPVVAVPTPEPEPELVDELLANAVPIAGGLGVIGLLGGLAFFMRRRKKGQKNVNPLVDSTFLESRLQPDSFFGASGGNRVNTNDNNGPGSSMAYTPSQMDASGDVDPVAEADVYLAYGRDEQAEDILKEALHTYPGRVAIHAKLLEIYKTRRDLKTFESVAAEAFKLTQGQGPEWAYIVELGSELDPANPLYHAVEPAPFSDKRHDEVSPVITASSPVVPEPLPTPPPVASVAVAAAVAASAAASASSIDLDMDFSLDAAPQVPVAPVAVSAPPPSVAPPPPVTPEVSSPASAHTSTLDDLDLGLDFDLPPTPAPVPTPPAAPAQAASPSIDLLSHELEFEPTPIPPKPSPAPASAAPAAHSEGMMEFDLDAFSLDLGGPATAAPTPAPAPAPAAAPAPAQAEPQEEDPLEIKFMLAEEFSSLGDTDGARALADEVLAKAKGPLKTKVQAFLNALS